MNLALALNLLVLGICPLSGVFLLAWYHHHYPRRRKVDLTHIMANFLKVRIEPTHNKKEWS